APCWPGVPRAVPQSRDHGPGAWRTIFAIRSAALVGERGRLVDGEQRVCEVDVLLVEVLIGKDHCWIQRSLERSERYSFLLITMVKAKVRMCSHPLKAIGDGSASWKGESAMKKFAEYSRQKDRYPILMDGPRSNRGIDPGNIKI